MRNNIDYRGFIEERDDSSNSLVINSGNVTIANGTLTVGGLVVATVGPATTLHVDPVSGSDTTGTRGNAGRPFQTIQAAVNAMQTDDTISLAPQIFLLTSSILIPSGVTRGAMISNLRLPSLSIASSMTGPVVRQLTSGQPCVEFGAALGMTKFTLYNIQFLGISGTQAISANGALAAHVTNSFFSVALNILDCPGNVFAKYVTQLVIQGSAGSLYNLQNCGNISFINVRAGAATVQCGMDPSDPMSPNFGTNLVLQSSIIGGGAINTRVIMSGTVQFRGDQFSSVGGLLGSNLYVTGSRVPAISYCGYVGNTPGLDFHTAGSEIPDTTTQLNLDFSGARFFHLTSNTPPVSSIKAAPFVKFKISGSASNPQTIIMDSSEAIPGTVFTAGANTHIVARGARWPSASLLTPDTSGSILPPAMRLASVVATNATTFSFGHRVPTTDYFVSAMSDTTSSLPTGAVTRTTASFVVHMTGSVVTGSVTPYVMFV